MTVFINRLRTQKGSRLTRTGRPLTKAEKGLYGNTPMMRYIAGTKEPIYPIGFVQHKPPWTKKRKSNLYSPEGRQEIHDNLRINTSLMVQLMNTKSNAQSTEFSDNRISLFSAQWGKCAVTGKEFQCLEDIHCQRRQNNANNYTANVPYRKRYWRSRCRTKPLRRWLWHMASPRARTNSSCCCPIRSMTPCG